MKCCDADIVLFRCWGYQKALLSQLFSNMQRRSSRLTLLQGSWQKLNMLLLLHFQRNYHWRWHWNQPSADCRQRVPEAWHRAETHTQRSGWTPPLGRGGLPVLKMAREVKWDNRGPEHWPQRSTFSMAGADFKALVFLISVANIPSSPLNRDVCEFIQPSKYQHCCCNMMIDIFYDVQLFQR